MDLIALQLRLIKVLLQLPYGMVNQTNFEIITKNLMLNENKESKVQVLREIDETEDSQEIEIPSSCCF